MSTVAEEEIAIPADLIEQAMLLSPAAKQKLGFMLLDSVAGPPADPELVRKETHELIKDRVEGFLSGKYPAVDARESLERVRAQLRAEFPQTAPEE